MKNLLLISLFFNFFTLPAAQAGAESCQAVFSRATPLQAPSGLSQRDFDAIENFDQLKLYAENLIAKNTDWVSLTIALWETKAAKQARWYTDDVFLFLLHLESKYGIRPNQTSFPSNDITLNQTNNIQSRYDIERYTIAQLVMAKNPLKIHQLLMESNYVKAKRLTPEDVQFQIENAQTRMQQFRDWLRIKNTEGPQLAQVLQAQSSLLEKAHGQSISKESRNDTYLKLLTGDNAENPDLKVVWRVNSPENPVEISENYWRLRPTKKPTIDYLMDSEPEIPFKSVTRFLGKPAPDARFFELVYKNYQDRFRDDLVAKAKKVEESLPSIRQSYGIVFEQKNQESIGSVRVFDGTPHRISDVFNSYRSSSSPTLPFEAIFKMRNIPVKFIAKLEQMRITNPYTPIFELGKLSLNGSVKVRDRSLKALEFFFLHYFLDRYPNGIYIVHVTSEAHLKLYQKRYGFKIEESIPIPGTDQVEHVLTLSGTEFREALIKKLGLSSD